MIVTSPTSVQAQRQPAAAQTNPSTTMVGGNSVLGRTQESLDHDPQVVRPFLGELQRLGAALSLPRPLLSQTSLAGDDLQPSDNSQLPDRPDEASGSEAPLAAMQAPVMPFPNMQLLAPSASTPSLLTEPLSLIESGRTTGLQALGGATVEAALAPSTGLFSSSMVTASHSTALGASISNVTMVPPTPASPTMNLAAGLSAVVSTAPARNEMASASAPVVSRVTAPFAETAASSELVATSTSVSTLHARATPANINMVNTLGALSPEAAAVRERSTGHATGAPTADLLAQTASVTNSDTAPPQVASVHSNGTATRVPQALVDALGERIEWQLKTGSERAVIRLDPPMQGQLEITIRRDAGAIQVHLSATHGDVVKQLQGISDTLRQELAGRQTGEVVVVVSHNTASGRDGDGRGRQPGQTPEQAEPGRALAEAESGQPGTRFALSQSL